MALEEKHREMKSLSRLFSLRSIVWELGQIARYCRAIAEVAINRTLEKPTRLCSFEKIELTKL